MKPLASGFVVSTAIRLRRLVELPALAQEKKVAHVSKSQATVVLTTHDQVFYPKCIQFLQCYNFYNVTFWQFGLVLLAYALCSTVSGDHLLKTFLRSFHQISPSRLSFDPRNT
jgi:hypothetical protein